LSNRLYANTYFKKKKNRSIEVSDSVLDYGDSLILIEHKGGYLSLEEKYSDDVDELLKGVAKKFKADGVKNSPPIYRWDFRNIWKESAERTAA
jgi:hypothetical protein